MNDSKTENLATSDFFLPLYNKCRFMIAGSGQQCLVKSLALKCLMKTHAEDDKNSNFTQEKRNCDCCTIF